MSGWGAVFNTVKMEPGKSLAVFGLGALGLSVIQAAKKAGATDIVGVDINDAKDEVAKVKDCPFGQLLVIAEWEQIYFA